MENKTDRQLVEDKNYNELYNRYNLKILKEAFKVSKSNRDDFIQESYFTVMNAVDKADLEREWESFNTILFYHMRNLVNRFKFEENKESLNSSFESDGDFDTEAEGSTCNPVLVKLVKNQDPSIMAYHPENILTKDREKEVEDKYNKFVSSLPEQHRKYLDLKIKGTSREEMAKQLGKRVTQLSLMSHEVKIIATEVFGFTYMKHKNTAKARRLMVSV